MSFGQGIFGSSEAMLACIFVWNIFCFNRIFCFNKISLGWDYLGWLSVLCMFCNCSQQSPQKLLGYQNGFFHHFDQLHHNVFHALLWCNNKNSLWHNNKTLFFNGKNVNICHYFWAQKDTSPFYKTQVHPTRLISIHNQYPLTPLPIPRKVADFQQSFPCICDQLRWEEVGKRKIILTMIVLLYNLCSQCVGINQLLNMSNLSIKATTLFPNLFLTWWVGLGQFWVGWVGSGRVGSCQVLLGCVGSCWALSSWGWNTLKTCQNTQNTCRNIQNICQSTRNTHMAIM